MYEELNKEELLNLINSLEKENKNVLWKNINEIEHYKEQSFSLKLLSSVQVDNSNNKNNIAIIGDTLKSLNLLQYKYCEEIDVIYIDIPYFSDKVDVKFGDDIIDINDPLRRSKYMNFLINRISKARELLKEDGLVFMSIDDKDYASLKIACDSILGEANFIGTFTWIKNSGKNNSILLRNITENILCYCKNKKTIPSENDYFMSEKAGYNDVLAIVKKMKREGFSEKDVELELKKFYSKNKDMLGSIVEYKYVEEGTFKVYRQGNPGALKNTENHYSILHPATKKVCKTPTKGWRWKTDTIESMLEKNLFHFGKDETVIPFNKIYLEDNKFEKSNNIIRGIPRNAYSFKKIFNNNEFVKSSKSELLIEKLINFLPKKDITVLSMFENTGATLHAANKVSNDRNVVCISLVDSKDTDIFLSESILVKRINYFNKNNNYLIYNVCECTKSSGDDGVKDLIQCLININFVGENTNIIISKRKYLVLNVNGRYICYYWGKLSKQYIIKIIQEYNLYRLYILGEKHLETKDFVYKLINSVNYGLIIEQLSNRDFKCLFFDNI